MNLDLVDGRVNAVVGNGVIDVPLIEVGDADCIDFLVTSRASWCFRCKYRGQARIYHHYQGE